MTDFADFLKQSLTETPPKYENSETSDLKMCNNGCSGAFLQ